MSVCQSVCLFICVSVSIFVSCLHVAALLTVCPHFHKLYEFTELFIRQRTGRPLGKKLKKFRMIEMQNIYPWKFVEENCRMNSMNNLLYFNWFIRIGNSIHRSYLITLFNQNIKIRPHLSACDVTWFILGLFTRQGY